MKNYQQSIKQISARKMRSKYRADKMAACAPLYAPKFASNHYKHPTFPVNEDKYVMRFTVKYKMWSVRM